MGTLTATDIAAMTAQDARQRARRDDDELRLRGVISESRKFDPMQKRDDHGRWSKIGAVLHAIAKAAGVPVVGHETFGAEEGNSHSHGIVAMHPGGDYTLALPDGDSGARPVMNIPDDGAREELRAAFEDVIAAHHRDPSGTGSIEADNGSWRIDYTADGATLHANLDDDAEIEQVRLSHADVETMESALSDVADKLENAGYPDYTAPLAPGEGLRGRKKLLGAADSEFSAVAAVVDTEDGPHVRLGAIQPGDGGAKDWTAGRGMTTVDLDQADATRVADVLERFDAEGKRRQAIYDKHVKAATKREDAGEDVDWDAVLSAASDELGYNTNGSRLPSEEEYGKAVVETPWGTIRLTDVGMDDENNGVERHVRMEIWPAGMTEEEYDAGQSASDGPAWAWPGADGSYQKPDPSLLPKDVRALIKILRSVSEPAASEQAQRGERLMKWDPTEHPRAPKGSDARQFTEALHPRVPSGATAGEFTKGGQKPAAKKAAAKKSADPPPETEVGSGKSSKARGPRVRIPKGALGYDPASNHGTGYGVKGGDKRVHTLQQALNRLGFTDMHGKKLRDDGELGPLTTAAVKKAQRALGVKADGIVTPQLLKRIEAMKPNRRRTATAKSATTTKRRSAAMELCTRAFDFEFDSDTRDGRTLEGYAAVFDTPARIRDLQGDFDETIRPGAFKRSLAVRTPVLQFDHGKDPRIGGTPIGKIDALSEDSRGLHVRARLFTHPDVERVREAIAEGAVNGMSFRFGVPDKGDVWGRNADGVDTREIRDADIHELGPVVFPAYDQTSVSVRSLLSQLGPEETRELLHELAGHLGLAVDLQDLTGRPSARSAGGGDIGTSPGVGRVPATPSTRQLLDHGTLRLKGIIK